MHLQYIILSILFVSANFCSYGLEYHRPIPTDITLKSPSKAQSVHEASIVYHIHRSLFEQDGHSGFYSNLLEE